MIRDPAARRAKQAAVEALAELRKEGFDIGALKASSLATVVAVMRDNVIAGGVADELAIISNDEIPDVLIERACGKGLRLAIEDVRKDSERAHRDAKHRIEIRQARGAL